MGAAGADRGGGEVTFELQARPAIVSRNSALHFSKRALVANLAM
jgi:hypothetical protein